MTKPRFAMFGGNKADRERIVAELASHTLQNSGVDVAFALMFLGEEAPQPVDVRARLIEIGGAPLFLVGQNRLDFAVRAAKLGAADYLANPLDIAELVRRLADSPTGRNPLSSASASTSALIGVSAGMARVRAQIEMYGPGTEPVMVLGESGTGKELAARAIHLASPRRHKALHAINCSTIVDTLAEGELFGARRGAFTGAAADREGLFSAANGSTLFFDEVGTASPSLQAKLLRVLENGEFLALGATAPTHVDVRIVAATNADLREARSERQFRDDLYYRLAGAVIVLPPLRERLEDLPLLVGHHLNLIAARLRRPVPRVEPEVYARLRMHAWPGNIRELMHVMANAVAISGGDVIHASDVPLGAGTRAPLLPFDEAKHGFEKDYVETVLRITQGNVTEAARIAGRNRKDMYKLCERAGVDPTRFRASSPAG